MKKSKSFFLTIWKTLKVFMEREITFPAAYACALDIWASEV
jgi:hypothetical protein